MRHHDVRVGRERISQGKVPTAAGRIHHVSENPVGGRPACGQAAECYRTRKVGHRRARRVLGGDAHRERDVHVLRRSNRRPLEVIYLSGQSVVIEDRAHALAVAQSRVPLVVQLHEERFVRLDSRVAEDRHDDRLVGLARVKRQKDVVGPHVVAARQSRVVGRVVPDGHRPAAGRGEPHREQRVARAGVALDEGHVVDGEDRQRIVIDDRAQALAVQDGGIGGPGKVDEESFIRLIEQVPDDGHGDVLVDLPGIEEERSIGAHVVAAGRRGVVGRGIVDRHRLRRSHGQPDPEEGIGCSGIAFVQGHIVHRNAGYLHRGQAHHAVVAQIAVRLGARDAGHVVERAGRQGPHEHYHGRVGAGRHRSHAAHDDAVRIGGRALGGIEGNQIDAAGHDVAHDHARRGGGTGVAQGQGVSHVGAHGDRVGRVGHGQGQIIGHHDGHRRSPGQGIGHQPRAIGAGRPEVAANGAGGREEIQPDYPPAGCLSDTDQRPAVAPVRDQGRARGQTDCVVVTGPTAAE